jgi:endonuclease-3
MKKRLAKSTPSSQTVAKKKLPRAPSRKTSASARSSPPAFRLLQRDRLAVALWLRDRLAERYPETPVPLHHRDAYTLLIAVLLSAQCTDARVNTVTPQLWKLADTPEKMAVQSAKDVESLIRSCGLAPQKSKAIVELSKILVRLHKGQVPRDLHQLEELPGVGHKTAQVVMAQAFGVPSFPVDTHIHRLAARWGLSSGKNVLQTERDLKQLFAPEDWNALHLRIIFYGREHCTARGCDGPRAHRQGGRLCPLCSALATSSWRS